MTTSLVAVTGNTYPVKDQLKALGARWNPDAKAWMVAPDKADAARAIVAGRSSATPAYRPGMMTEAQRITLSKLMRRVEHIRMFDSFGGNGAQLVDEIRTEIDRLGGTAKLTSKQASNFISTLIGAADDEM